MAATSDMQKFRAQLGRRFGDRLTIPPAERKVQYEIIPTGSLSLDIALGTGGWVRGRTHELIGLPGASKTTISILSGASHQKATGKAVGWIDMEQSFDFDWAASLGLDISEEAFTHISPDDSEDVSDMLRLMGQTDLYGLNVIDSIGGMESRKAFEKDAAEVTMGKNAQVITKMVKQAATLAHRHRTTVLYVNQLRANLSGMGGDVAAGPKALQYNTTFSVKLTRLGMAGNVLTIGSGDKMREVGRKYKAVVQRSRVSPQGRIAEFFLINEASDRYGPVGIDRVDEAINVGLRLGIIAQSGGGFYTPPGMEKSIRGRDSLVEALRAEPTLVEAVREEAIKKMAHTVTEETEFAEGETDD